MTNQIQRGDHRQKTFRPRSRKGSAVRGGIYQDQWTSDLGAGGIARISRQIGEEGRHNPAASRNAAVRPRGPHAGIAVESFTVN